MDQSLKIQMQPNRWSCLPTAFAMALDISVKEVIDIIGHDGSEIIFPQFKEPACRRSFHIQEMIDVCMLRDVAVIQIEVDPVSCVKENSFYKVPVSDTRLDYYLSLYTGVFVGVGSMNTPHAVAWSGRQIFDPNGTVYYLSDFKVEVFFILHPLH